MSRFLHRVPPGALVLAFGIVVTTGVVAGQLVLDQADRYQVRQTATLVIVLAAIPAATWWSRRLFRVALVLWAVVIGLLTLGSFATFTAPLILLATMIAAEAMADRRPFAPGLAALAGSLVVSIALVAGTWAIALPGSGRWEDVSTAGNRTVYFFGDVGQGQCDDKATANAPCRMSGGPDDGWASAYGQLCPAIRARVSLDEFRASHGSAVSEALTATGYSGSRHGDNYLTGIDEQRPDMDTLDQDVTNTWLNADLSWSDYHDNVYSGRTRTEVWRIDLTRERRTWRVCGFTRVS